MSPFWVLLELRMMEVSGDKWSYKKCKAPVKSSSTTNQHPVFYRPDVLPVAQPTVSEHWRKRSTDYWTKVNCYSMDNTNFETKYALLQSKQRGLISSTGETIDERWVNVYINIFPALRVTQKKNSLIVWVKVSDCFSNRLTWAVRTKWPQNDCVL